MEQWFRTHMQLTPKLVCDWRTLPHASLEQMLGVAKASDLTVFGPHHPILSLEASPGVVPEDIALRSGRPVLVAPQKRALRQSAMSH